MPDIFGKSSRVMKKTGFFLTFSKHYQFANPHINIG
jgi:hypothetical protein